MGILIRRTLKHACTRGRRHALLLPGRTTRPGWRLLQKTKICLEKKLLGWSKVKSVHAGEGSGGGKDQQPHQHSCTENSSQMHQHSRVIAVCCWSTPPGGVSLNVAEQRPGACCRRVPPPLINNSDNMIYATHFAHKITGCNCLPDVFGTCCSFLSASW